MSGLTLMLSVWSVLACLWIVLFIYRTILGNREGDQLFLDRAVAGLEQEQTEVLKRINRLDPLILWLGIVVGALILCIAGWWMYQGLFMVAPPPVD